MAPKNTRSRHRRSARAPVSRSSGPWVFIVVILLLVAGGGVAIYLQRSSGGPKRAKPPAGVQRFSNLERTHVSGRVDYPQNPPVGGPHAPVWLNCGYYPGPIPSENAVHSMEHGAVWITYRPGISPSQIGKLRDLAGPYVIVSPDPNLTTDVVASAWGVQLRASSVSDKRIAQFVDAYRSGPQTPERGAVCSGGVGQPQ